MLEQVIVVFHVLVALGIVGLVLLQQGKGADMGASFGGGGSQTLFGAAGGGSVLTRATAILAATFFVTSFGLAILAKQKANEMGGLDSMLPEAVINVADPAADARAELEAQLDQIPEPSGDTLPGKADVDGGSLDIVDELPQ